MSVNLFQWRKLEDCSVHICSKKIISKIGILEMDVVSVYRCGRHGAGLGRRR